MALSLSTVQPAKGARTSSKRIGRGNGSGRGNYSGKGIKGQKARTGGRNKLKRMSFKYILQRLPKRRGFTSIHKKPETISLDVLQAINESKITPALLYKLGLVRTAANGVKILVGKGEIKRILTISGCTVSDTARAKIESAGGKIES